MIVGGAGPGFGVYVHVPFCHARCDYCAFATWTDRHHLMEDYARACRSEVDSAVAGGMPEATSVFFGGGTPSLLPAASLTSILDAIPRRGDAEVTVECNPESLDRASLEAYMGAGVNRVSLGVQSMVPRVLAGLGRAPMSSLGGVRLSPPGRAPAPPLGRALAAYPAPVAGHDGDPEVVARAVGLLGWAGISTFNVDLIYGGAGESDADWAASLAGVLALEPRPDHVSAYALTVEPGTPLAGDQGRHPDPDVQASRYELTDNVLSAAGLEWYELSNWSLPGHECRHNQLYWDQGEYRGFGCAAHSHQDGRRWWNVRTPERYMELVASGRSVVAGEVRLDDRQRQMEGLQLALRTRQGVPSAALDQDDVDLAGLVGHAGGRAVLTLKGRLLANEVTSRLLLDEPVVTTAAVG